MVDYSADEISTEEAGVLIRALDDAFGSDSLRLYPGISYRHCLVLRHGKDRDILYAAARHHLKSLSGATCRRANTATCCLISCGVRVRLLGIIRSTVRGRNAPAARDLLLVLGKGQNRGSGVLKKNSASGAA